MRYFLDTEFIDKPGCDVQLISIGMVTQHGAGFYAVSSEFDRDVVRQDPWLSKHVLPHVDGPGLDGTEPKPQAQIAADLARFCAKHDDGRKGEVWAWNGAYDFYLLMRLFGGRMAMPAAVPTLFLDLKQWAIAQGNPTAPAQELNLHHALADAHHDRALHAWLTEREQKLRHRRTERIRTRLLTAMTSAGRDLDLGA